MGRRPDDEEYAAFVHASWPSLYRAAYMLLGDHGLAEDLVQTVLANTYAAWGRVREVDAAPGYARTALFNTAASWFRRRSWRREVPSEVLPDGGYADIDASARPAVLDALRQLPPGQRAIVVLRYYEDLSVRQTANALGVSEGTVKSQTSVALARLRTVLGEWVVPIDEGAR